MKAFFNYEFKQGVIKKDPSDAMRAPKIEKKVPTVLSVDEVNRLLAQPDGTSRPAFPRGRWQTAPG